MKTTITTTTITDDLGGAGDAQTVRFDYDGTEYEIDLNARNRETFERRVKALYAPYIAVARETGTTADRRHQARLIRTWAAQNGHDIAPRGRVPQDIIDAYNTAQAER